MKTMNTLRELAYFFQNEMRNHHGGMFHLNGHTVNETERNLSLYTDNELLELVDGCNRFKDLIAAEMDSRRA